jgi:hypothetical protein
MAGATGIADQPGALESTVVQSNARDAECYEFELNVSDS